MSEEYPECVFYEDVKCRVRYEMQRSESLQTMVSSIKQEDSEFSNFVKSITSAMNQMLSMNWSSLASFCSICLKNTGRTLS